MVLYGISVQKFVYFHYGEMNILYVLCKVQLMPIIAVCECAVIRMCVARGSLVLKHIHIKIA